MLEDLLFLKMVIYFLIIVVLVLAVRFLWSVPSSLKLLVFYAEEFYEKLHK